MIWKTSIGRDQLQVGGIDAADARSAAVAGRNHDGPELVAEEQAEDKRDADAANGQQQALPEFLEMLEEAHPRHALFFVVRLRREARAVSGAFRRPAGGAAAGGGK